MDIFLSICLGIGLSAACGFRVFVPFLAMSVASLSGNLTLSQGFEWIGSYPGLIVFATAAALEIAAYYIPWVDNLMDAVTAPAAVIAGTIAAASSITEMSPLLKWSLALIAGGGTAAVFHASTSLLRGASTSATGGLGNHAVATAELGIASVLSLTAILIPVLSGIAILILLLFVIKRLVHKVFRGKKAIGASP